MRDTAMAARTRSTISLHKLGVFCGLAAAVWLGSAEAPTKLVNEGFSPFLISMGMVMGAFVARWSLPTMLKGTGFVFTEPGNREVSFLRAAPVLSGSGDGVAGEISSNSGGTAKAEIMAICLNG